MQSFIDQLFNQGKSSFEDNNRLIKSLIGLLDLQTSVPEEGVRAVYHSELEDIKSEFIGSLDEGDTQIALEIFSETNDIRESIAALRSKSINISSQAYEKAINRLYEIEKRISYLMRPSTPEEVENLDPYNDSDQIYHAISYEFRLEQKLFANLFEARPTVLPTGSLLFHSTGEFTLRSVKRINDTALFFSNMLEWGLESKRGRDTIARLNNIHGRYFIASDTFKFILGNIMFVPELWNKKLGWRPLTEHELQGWYHAFAKLGRAMNIQDIPHDREDMRKWWIEYAAEMADTTPVQRKTFDEIVIQVLAVYPKKLRHFALNALLVGMDDLYRNALGYPQPPEEKVSELKAILAAVGRLGAMLPRIPWVRSLQIYPMGFKTDWLGVNKRSNYMPALSNDGENKGYPSKLKPLNNNEGHETIFESLPTITNQELKQHNKAHDAWVAIDKIVYDLTPFFYEHPGSYKVLERWLGQDATEAFNKVAHSPEARALMLNFRVAKLEGAINKAHAGKLGVRNKRRPTWQAQDAISSDAWEALLTGILEAVDAYEKGLKQTMKQQGPVAPFPVQLPSHEREQGVMQEPEQIKQEVEEKVEELA